MIPLRLGRCRIEINFSCFVLLAFCCIFAGMGSSAFFFLAVLFHESAHLAAMWALGAPPERVALSALGCRIEPCRDSFLSDKSQSLISLAGPGINLFLSLIFFALGQPALAGTNLALGIIHSLPVEPLDGGLALRYLLRSRWGAQKAELIGKITSVAFIFPLAVLGFFVLLRTQYNYSLLALSTYLMLYLVLGKDDAQA